MKYDYQIIHLTGDPRADMEALNRAGIQEFRLVNVVSGWAFLMREVKPEPEPKVTVTAEGQVKPKTTRKRKTTKAA